MKIAYEPHPVTPERKAELRKAGFKIMDVRFKPKDPITRETIGGMKKADVVELLEMHGADVEGNLPELRERLMATMFLEAS